MSGNYFCHICGGLVDLIRLQPSGVRFCECEKRFAQLRAENAALKAELAEAKKDAERYRWLKNSDCLSYVSDTGPRPSTAYQRLSYALKMHDKQTSDMIEIRLLCYHLGPQDEPRWIDGKHFDYVANMDAAIDAAMKGK